MVILISDAFDDQLNETLKAFGEVTTDKSRQSEAEIILIRSKTKVTREYIDASPNLRMVIRGGVGLDNVDQVYASEKGIIVKNTAEASTTAVAELAFALMIALPNHIARADLSMKEGKWLKKELKRTELFGKTLGILGLGRIGLGMALRARAFFMNVVGWNPHIQGSEFVELCPTLENMLNRSDYVSIHLPLQESTKGIINKETLKSFKHGAYLINTGRGGCIVEDDVVEALKSGQLAGYATDVWNTDPPENSPLINAPNCIFTPHIGASTKENMGRIGKIVERLIGNYINEMQEKPVS